MRSITSSIIAAAIVGTALGACVTINIYFPAAAAERVADQIIDEVWQLKPGAEKSRSDKPAAPQ
jgi:hypothetical protein